MTSQMRAEIMSIPEVVARQVAEMGPRYREIGLELREAGIRAAVSNARGTSDHAATYLKYLMETMAGVPLASVGPSVASVYGSSLRLDGQLCVTISQSGASRDLVMMQKAAAEAGALTLALVNDVSSPLARSAALLAPLHAGPELAVAATKTFVTSQVAAATIVAAWTGADDVLAAVGALPDALARDRPGLVHRCRAGGRGHVHLHDLARAGLRGGGRGGAQVQRGLPASRGGLQRSRTEAWPDRAVRSRLRGSRLRHARRGMRQHLGGREGTARDRCGCVPLRFRAGRGHLPLVLAPHTLLDPICLAATFYAFVERVARARGLDPDRPPNLSKVTVTQ